MGILLVEETHRSPPPPVAESDKHHGRMVLCVNTSQWMTPAEEKEEEMWNGEVNIVDWKVIPESIILLARSAEEEKFNKFFSFTLILASQSLSLLLLLRHPHRGLYLNRRLLVVSSFNEEEHEPSSIADETYGRKRDESGRVSNFRMQTSFSVCKLKILRIFKCLRM